LFVARGPLAGLASTQRHDFIANEWPLIRDRMARLGIDPAELFQRA